jgi:hypothetical protein
MSFRFLLDQSAEMRPRLPLDTTADQKIDWLRRLLTTHRADLGRYIVVEPGRIRVA